MDLVLKGRGVPISERVRRNAEHRVAKLDGPRRPAVTRLEVEIIEEGSARVGGGHRVELTCVTTRPTFFAEASGQTIDEALDHALTRLARQIERYRGKREAKLTRAGRRSGVEPTFDGEPAPVAEVEASP